MILSDFPFNSLWHHISNYFQIFLLITSLDIKWYVDLYFAQTIDIDMRVYILSFLLSALFIVSECLFFGIPKSTCSYDNQCLKTRRCIERSNPFCQKSSKSNNFKKSMIFQQFLLIISCYLVLANNQTQITMLIAFWYVYKLRGQNLRHL